MYNKTKCGFTLAELMAVVIIVALLAALGTGYYRRSVEQSRFSEGLMTASAIVEGINRDYLEQRMNGVADPSIPRLNQLDIGISGTVEHPTACESNVCHTQYFDIRAHSDGMITAGRVDGIYQGAYDIQIQPHFAQADRDQISCKGNTADGLTFCQAMGYTSCASDDTCTKPN